jgi:hypothetical protein
MKRFLTILALFLSVWISGSAQKNLRQYIFFELERDRIHDTSFLNNELIEGAQLKYMWGELEPEKNQYNLALIQNDLDYLSSHGKKLFIQLQDVTFDTIFRKPVPEYLLTDKKYHGGVNLQYETNDKDEITGVGGYVARRWDKNVADRFNKLLTVLGRSFDGKIEGINLPETSVEFGSTGKLYPAGFSPERYRDAIIEYMTLAKNAFPSSVVIQYANFMPGDWLQHNGKLYLKSLYEFASKHNIGMGGPDIKIYQKYHMNNGYKFLSEYASSITSGVAVQDGNYEEINPKTGKQVTVDEIYDFANTYLGLDYIFWCTQEPYYTRDLLPFLRSFSRR